MTKDLTSGSPLKLIFSFSIPVLIGNIFQQLYSMVDAIIVGRFVGVDALAAVGATGAMSFLVLGFVIGLTGGFSVMAAQRFGAGDEDGLRHSISISAVLSILVALLLTGLSVWGAGPVLAWMGTPPEIMETAHTYIVIIFAGTGASMFYNLLSGILRALGDSKTPLYFLILSSLLNIVLDLVLIINFHMGVAGAAYATIASQLISGILCFLYMAKKFPLLHLKRRDWYYDVRGALIHLNLGVPMALQFSITAIGIMVLQWAINGFGPKVIAGYTAASKVEQLITQPMLTIGITMATFSGQNLGAGKISRIREGVKAADFLSIVCCIACGVLVFLFGTPLTMLFLDGYQPEVIAASRQYLTTISLFFIVLGLLFVYRNTLQGLGHGLLTMVAGAAELVMRVVVSVVFAATAGYQAICFASPVAWIGATVPLILIYHRIIKKLELSQRTNQPVKEEIA